MNFGIGNALRNPAAGSYDPTPIATTEQRPEWANFLDDLADASKNVREAADVLFDIYERIDYPSWKRVQDQLALAREIRLAEEARAKQGVAITPGPVTPKPALEPWVWVALGVGGAAVVLLIVKQMRGE